MAKATYTSILPGVKKVAALLRISEEKRDATGKRVTFEETLKNHKSRITAFCEENDLKVTWFEEVISGASALEKRTELNDLLDNLEKFDAILVMELPRLARQGLISQHIKTKVIQYRKLIIQLNPFKVFDMANNPMDGMFYDFGSAMAEYERRVIGERIKMNKIVMSKNGLNASGSVPQGYKRNSKTKLLEIDPEGAEVVKEAFKTYLDGKGYAGVCIELNEAGYRSKTGSFFVPNTIKTMLKCETYKGNTVYHEMIKNGKKKEIKETIRVNNTHPAIIDPETFDQVQQLIQNRAERSGGGREKPSVNTSIVKDLLFCPDCGRKVRIAFEAKRKGNHIRKCFDFKRDGITCKSTGMNAAPVEAAILQKIFTYKEELKAKIQNYKSEDFNDFQVEVDKQITEAEKRLKKLQNEFNAIRTEERNYNMEKDETGIKDDFLEEQIAEDKKTNSAARMKMQQQIKELQEKLKNAGSPETEIKKLQEQMDIIEQIKNNPDPLKINMLLKRIIHKIYYKRVLPPELASLPTLNKKRLEFMPEIKIEYIQ